MLALSVKKLPTLSKPCSRLRRLKDTQLKQENSGLRAPVIDNYMHSAPPLR